MYPIRRDIIQAFKILCGLAIVAAMTFVRSLETKKPVQDIERHLRVPSMEKYQMNILLPEKSLKSLRMHLKDYTGHVQVSPSIWHNFCYTSCSWRSILTK